MKRYSIESDGQEIGYDVVHRPAVTRGIYLELGEQGELQVVAPRRMSRRAVQAALQQKALHVARFLVEARRRQQDMPRYEYTAGEQHPFMGQWLSLEIHRFPGKRVKVELAGGRIKIHAPLTDGESIRTALGRWYRQQAETRFGERLDRFCHEAPWTGTKRPGMRLRLMKRTWGSCSVKGMITLNPHLVKAPPNCIDYIIAHEVCHLKEHNHGKGFYALQDRLFPGWREAEAHLRNKGHVYLQ